MARVTALKAYSRAKLKQTRTQDAKINSIEGGGRILRSKLSSVRSSSNNTSRQLAHIANKVLNLNTRRSLEPPLGSGEKDSKSGLGLNLSNSSRKKTKREIALDNKKITDYYSKCSRGRENLPKSPIHITRLSHPISFHHSTTATMDKNSNIPQAKKKSRIVEIVTICDSDDEDYVVKANRLTTQKLIGSLSAGTLPMDIEMDVKKEEDDFEEDVEVLEMLPPIPLRDHPVHDLLDDD